MPICITCSTPVKELYTIYSKADDRTLGKGVRLTQCPNCKRFADKYVEHDFVVLFIDLVLIKPQVYRHLLFNRLGRSDDKFDPSILRLGTLLVLFDVYITWARVEQSNAGSGGRVDDSRLSEMPILAQYLFFLTMNVLATCAQHGIIRLLTRILSSNQPTQSQGHVHEGAPPPTPASTTTAASHANPSAISTALLVSSCTKLFPILLVIWPTEANEGDSFGFAFRATNYVGWAVLLNNIEALLILLDCGYVVATALAISGFLARWMVEGWFLSFVGSAGDTGPVGDLLAAYSFMRAWLGIG
ncbi:hypothetical protein A1O7_05884 [Cladophialophora yegresii CBS 114405]|uniref:Protein ARV n=1 Tax=Cladophialophora yegresii CBS 114405 TaxID=1182544 RepID=W9WIY3_9EURO|nr:uncharacterized protein A1O7_05884 [Cladophialophora yegresii CBS 114405]EXJ58459.1 hypothetical protein A1O7_05884 [Cladophialophora yegresii CBS 114405]